MWRASDDVRANHDQKQSLFSFVFVYFVLQAPLCVDPENWKDRNGVDCSDWTRPIPDMSSFSSSVRLCPAGLKVDSAEDQADTDGAQANCPSCGICTQVFLKNRRKN